MNPEVIGPKQITLLGMAQLGQNHIDKLWQMFEKNEKDILNADPNSGYELHIFPEKHDRTSQIVVLAGFAINKIPADIPLCLMVKPLPVTKYAIFDYHLKDGDYVWINNQMENWLSNSLFNHHLNFSLQRYDQRFKGMDNEESIIQFYIPIN